MATPVPSISRRSVCATPFRTPNFRRFGPLGSSWRTPMSRHNNRTRRISTSTPVTRYAKNTESTDVTQLTDIEKNNLKQLTLKVWHVHRLTPLYNLKTQKSDLKMYSRNLSSFVAAEKDKGTFIDMSEPDSAEVGIFSGLDIGIDDAKALLVEIRGKARHKNEEKVLCQAVLFSTDLQYNPVRVDLQDSFTYYSTMLTRGPAHLRDTLCNWLERQFDCKIARQQFASHELGFMAAMFTGLDEDHKPVELVYKVPGKVEGLSDITYSTRHEDCLRLWQQIRRSDADIFTSEEAKQFIGNLENHFYEIFHIKLATLCLNTVGTPVAFVGADGRIKIHAKSPENVQRVLRHLTDLAMDHLLI